jgi:hypothetical protein
MAGAKSNAARGPATLGPHYAWFSGLPPSPRRRCNESSRPVSARCQVPLLPTPCQFRHLAMTNLAIVAVVSGLSCSEKQNGDEAASPDHQPRFRASGSFPKAILFRASPAATGSAAIIGHAQKLSRFAELTLNQNVAARNDKESSVCEETVDDCTSLWKTEEN